MDISKGIVEIDNELVVKPNFTFEQFKETKYYTNQDGIRIIYLDEPQIIKNRSFTEVGRIEMSYISPKAIVRESNLSNKTMNMRIPFERSSKSV